MAIFVNQARNSASWANISKNIAAWSNQARTAVQDFLLKEDGGYLLLENGDKIILEQSVGGNPT